MIKKIIYLLLMLLFLVLIINYEFIGVYGVLFGYYIGLIIGTIKYKL